MHTIFLVRLQPKQIAFTLLRQYVLVMQREQGSGQDMQHFIEIDNCDLAFVSGVGICNRFSVVCFKNSITQVRFALLLSGKSDLFYLPAI